MPPEFLELGRGLQALTVRERGVISRYYRNLKPDLKKRAGF